ncbi:MAG: TetR/AcrR family transcriptional regulator [Actinomycetota bacterium]|nr:TetR/AcrR family transcriptional regulator [Actinomycetota bacterium]
MARPAKYSTDVILDAARDIVVDAGPSALTVTAVTERLDAPSGSIYHRFGGRDQLAASLWVRCVDRFQQGYLERLAVPDPLEASLGAASHVVTFSRAHLGEARLLMVFRSQDLIHAAWPEDLRRANLDLQRRLEKAIGRLQSAFGATEPATRHRIRFAVVDMPYAAVRPALVAGKPPPPSADALVIEIVEHLLRPLLQ